jgi:uncharacterized protein (DUF305 family)
MNLRIRVGALGAAVTLSIVLAACGSSAPAASSSTVTSSTSLGATASAVPSTAMPPGSMSTAGSGMPMPSAPAGPHNQADITFAQMMTVHHKSAIEMADLAPSRASDKKVKDLAVQIKSAQEPEIKQMSSWLSSWAPATDMNGKPIATASSSSGMGGMSGMSGMDHGSSTSASMPGMMSGEQMDQLKAANGAPFDKMFLQLMIAHHQGALEMAKTEKSAGQNPAAIALADSITAGQTAEIATMADLLKGR